MMTSKLKSKITEIHTGKVAFSQEFTRTFPVLTQLLSMASVVEFTIDANQRFRQYIWTADNGTTYGWMCTIPHCIPQRRNIIPEQIMLAQECGGIINSWKPANDNSDMVVDTKEFAFALDDTRQGIGAWQEKYQSLCKEMGVEALDTKEFVTFAQDTNGDTTFYNYKTKEVYMYLHDGYTPLEFELVDNQPEYTIHRLTEVGSFVQYVELLAKEWLSALPK